MNQATRPEQNGLTFAGGRPREEDILTRRKTAFWDRIKWLTLLVIIWFVLVLTMMGSDPLIGFLDACRIQATMGAWVFVLIGLELLHQVHYFISERWAGYHQFWLQKIWGKWARFTSRRFSAWMRFRITRIFSWVVILVVIAIVAGKITHLPSSVALFRIPAMLWGALPFVLQMTFYLFFAVGQFALLFWFMSRGGVDVYYPDDIKTRFSDVWGQDHVLERVKENIIFLEHPEVVEDRGGYVPGGILLWGPPGTGKTLMAEAVAGETGKPYVFVDPGAFINMFMGVGILKVKSLFRKLRKLSLRYGGVIVFFDEADSLGNRGGAMGGAPGTGRMAPFASGGCHGFSYLSHDSQTLLTRSAMSSHTGDSENDTRRFRQIIGAGMNGGMGGGGMGTLQSLLTELSGLKKPRGFFNKTVRKALGMRPKPPPHYRILVMMATNMPSALDEALLRPGRIDRMYRVGYPSKEGRIRTYEGYFKKVSHELTTEQLDKLATITPYATGASIKDLVNEALITAIRDGRDVITWPDVIKAKQLRELGPAEDAEYIERERHAVAIHEACHAVVTYRTRQHVEIDLATIEKGRDYLGMVSFIKPEDQFSQWRSELEADAMAALASLAGERLFFDNDNSSGVSGDLEAATNIASLMEGFYGMGQTVSSLSSGQRLQIGAPGGQGKGNQEDAEAVARRMLADRIEDNLSTLLQRAEDILRENERYVLAVAHALETHKTFSGEDVKAIFEGDRGVLVDGTYYDDEFIAELREYHLLAKQAHHEHSKPNIPLPVAGPLPVAEVSVASGFKGDGAVPAEVTDHLESMGRKLDQAHEAIGNLTRLVHEQITGASTNGSRVELTVSDTGNGNGSHPDPVDTPTYDPPGAGGAEEAEGAAEEA
jgi:ATP-dependent Zn protease